MTNFDARVFRRALVALALAAAPAFGQLIESDDVARGAWDSMDVQIPMVEHPIAGCGKACACRALFAAGWQPGQLALRSSPPPGAVTDPTDVLNNNLSITVNPPSAAISGTNVMTIKSNVDGLSTFTFRLRSNFTVTNCTVTDSVGSYTTTPTTPPANNSSYGRTITFLRPINSGTVFTVSISYNGTAQSIGFGSFFTGTINGYNQVSTLSEPYYGGTWWPCKDGDVNLPGDNSDKATLDIWITAPSAYRSTANGVLVGVDSPSAGMTRYHYATSYQISTYLVCFATGVYNTWTTPYTYAGGTMPVEFNINPGDDNASHRTSWNNIVTMLGTFQPLYGLYPFINEKYGIYQFGFSGGMEHQTNTGQGVSGSTPFDEYITVHEMGHQWWGDNITCKYWNDIWLNEGFAVYTEAQWAERKPGSTGLPALKAAMLSRTPSTPVNSVWIPDAQTNSISRIFDLNSEYYKAAWVLHMLRHIVGDTTFYNILAAYRSAFAGSAAATSDFTGIASAVAGQDLSYFFTPWLYGSGAPTYAYSYVNSTIDGKNYLRFRVQQTQTATYATFDMPLDVRVSTSAGTQTFVVRNHTANDYFLLQLPTGASLGTVALDPDNWVLTYSDSQVGYIQGPPKIVTITPAPGSSATVANTPAQIRVAFSDPVTASAAQFAVTATNGSGTNPVPFTYSYDNSTSAALLTLTGPLAPGTYNVAVSDTIVVTALPTLKLDGELTSNSPAALPSGDGQPGGIATWSFVVTANPCAADFNNDGRVTIQDVFDFLTAWFAQSPGTDVNGDGHVTVQDIFTFLGLWFTHCQ